MVIKQQREGMYITNGFDMAKKCGLSLFYGCMLFSCAQLIDKR